MEGIDYYVHLLIGGTRSIYICNVLDKSILRSVGRVSDDALELNSFKNRKQMLEI